jgi:hypothetical protein
MLGPWLTVMTLMEYHIMLYPALGHSSANNIQMDGLRSSKHGINFFETYAPVVQWTTIRLMFILEILLGLKSKQGDVLCASLHGELEPGENVYVEMPLGFSQHSKDGTRKVLKLKRTLYGLHQSL